MSEWIQPIKANPTAVTRLICFHFAGGTAMAFRGWGNSLPPSVEVCAVQLPGRLNRIQEPAFSQLGPLMNSLVPALLPVLEEKPYAFFGYSFGALIAFELARTMRARNARLPSAFFCASRIAPQSDSGIPTLHDLPEMQFLNAVQEIYKNLPEVLFEDPDLRQMLLPTLRADFSVFETYQYRTQDSFQFPIVVMSGAKDMSISDDKMAEWSVHTQGRFERKKFSGGHFFIQDNAAEFFPFLSDQLSKIA